MERLQERLKAQVRGAEAAHTPARLSHSLAAARWGTQTRLLHTSMNWLPSGESACVCLLRGKPVLTHRVRRYDCHPIKSFVPMLAQAPLFISFFLAIQRMALLPSFESGGAAWFTNLAVADPMYIMPLLSGATFLATVEVCACFRSARAGVALTCSARRVNVQLGAVDGMQGNPAANNMKWAMRALAVVLVPVTASFPQVCCTAAPRASAGHVR